MKKLNPTDPQKKILFPAKRYGWGWGLPCAWQGWVVMVVWLLILTGVGFDFLPNRLWSIEIACLLLTALLIAICWWKGEKPRWRWGKDS